MTKARLLAMAATLETLPHSGDRGHDADVYEALGFEVVRLPEKPRGLYWRHKVDGRWVANRHVTHCLTDARSFLPPNHSYAIGNCGEDDRPWATVTCAETHRDFTSKGAASVELAFAAACLRARAEMIL